MSLSSSVDDSPSTPNSREPTTAPSSPPDLAMDADDDLDLEFADEEQKQRILEDKAAREENEADEERRKQEQLKKEKRQRKKKEEPKTRGEKAHKLEELLTKSDAFSNALLKKTETLGRVGSGYDGKALGEHNLTLAQQPKCMTGGTMRDYQLEGLTWMYEVAIQGLSGILADEMGLGKTIQTISLLAKYSDDGYWAPFLIIAPLSTLSNWMDEFAKWTPNLPVEMYHGTPPERQAMFNSLLKKYKGGKAMKTFPIVLTTPEIVIRDHASLSKISFETIIIDEGHRLKNADSKLFKILSTFTSMTRFLITGTPLQNNLKELWSLLHFLMPSIFTEWELFEAWFDFSDDMKDEERTREFMQDDINQDLLRKMHLILQPMLLRRVKADVEHLLPRKREYVLYAPLTNEQTELYNMINNKGVDTRQYLEDKVVERLSKSSSLKKALPSRPKANAPVPKKEVSDSEDDVPLSKLAMKNADRASGTSTPKNAFSSMMQNRSSSVSTQGSARGRKRKSPDTVSSIPASKSAKSSRASTPATSKRGRKLRQKVVLVEGNSDEEDALSDDDFEAKLAAEVAASNEEVVVEENEEEKERSKILALAKKEISNKKLGNPIMQLRLVCNSIHNFYNPWSLDSGLPIDETLVTSSGKMLLLDRLLPSLFSRGSKVLIFSQFKIQLDLLEDYARDLRGWNVCRIDGSVAQDDRRQQIKEFNENPDFRLFLLSTRAGGQGINLASADTVILYDSDWNPQQDLQAQDRAHRIGQKNPVIIYRLATKGTVEEELLLSAEGKRRLEKLVIKKGGFKNMHQKMDDEGMSKDALNALLLKDGEVYKYKGGDQILTDGDLDVICDRSDEAYVRAEKGLGDSTGFKVVETKVGGLMTGMEGRKGMKKEEM